MADKAASNHSDSASRNTFYFLYIVCGSLIAMILLLDLLIPLGVAIDILYISVVLISFWFPQKRYTVFIAVVCTLLTIGVFLYQPAVAEMWQVIFNRVLALLAIWVTTLLGLQRKIIEEKREIAFLEREKAMNNVRILQGLLPVCASCKKIRNDQGYWTQIEVYIRDHSEADFSHGICPECSKKLYPEFYKEVNPDSDTET